jgi:hypothetical protein
VRLISEAEAVNLVGEEHALNLRTYMTIRLPDGRKVQKQTFNKYAVLEPGSGAVSFEEWLAS